MTTKHTCNSGGGPVFGRKTVGCPRCNELIDGAPAVQWRNTECRTNSKIRSAEIRAHFKSHKHLTGGCGPVCTFGQW